MGADLGLWKSDAKDVEFFSELSGGFFDFFEVFFGLAVVFWFVARLLEVGGGR